MSKLDDLIREFCPDGVEYRELQTLAEIGTGNSDRKDSSEDGAYPFYVRSKEILRINKWEYDEEAIVIPGEGGIGEIFHFVNGKYALHQRAYRIHIVESALTTKFLYYYMFAHFRTFIMQKAVSATVTSIRKPMIEQFRVPVPPLEVQREIVQILDNFTELIAELSTELTARKKQYEYYRNELLSFDTSVPRKMMAEVCKISAGGDAPKDAMSKKMTDDYTIPIISNGIGENAFYGYTNEPKITEPAVTVAARGTIGYAEYRDYPYFPIIRLLSAIPKKKSELNTRYLYYCLQGKEYNVPTSGIPQLTAPMLKKVEIPIPKIDVQNRIVSILDYFDALCTDLSSGLPAEISTRQKQYEYYRDKLLTFKEA